jgi:hypothetical protein
MRPYHLTIEHRGDYLHATVVGERTSGNALRFLQESYAACVEHGVPNLLLEMNLTGPSLGTYDIYHVITDQSPDGARLRRIAYVEGSLDDLEQARFAETVAVNRAVNVRLFEDVAKAAHWLVDGFERP